MLSQETIDKLRKLEAYLLEVPGRFNLEIWGVHIDAEHANMEFWDKEEVLSAYFISNQLVKNKILPVLPPCGTVACLAGNVCVMEGLVAPIYLETIGPDEVVTISEIYRFSNATGDIAAKFLGLTPHEAERLFIPANMGRQYAWPEEWQEKLDEETPGTREYAQVAVDRIEHFIATGE